MTRDTLANQTASFLKWLPLLIVAASSLIAWAELKTTVTNNEKRITALEIDEKADRETQQLIQTTLTQIQTDILWIKKNIDK